MLGIPRLDDGQSDLIGISVLAWKVAIITCTAVTSVFSLLSALAAQVDKCAGRSWLVGYRSGISDFLAFPLISAVASSLFTVVLTRQKAWKILLDHPELNALGAPRGAMVLYFALAMGLIIFGSVTGVSVVRYDKIAHYCWSKTGLIPENSIAFPKTPSPTDAAPPFSH